MIRQSTTQPIQRIFSSTVFKRTLKPIVEMGAFHCSLKSSSTQLNKKTNYQTCKPNQIKSFMRATLKTQKSVQSFEDKGLIPKIPSKCKSKKIIKNKQQSIKKIDNKQVNNKLPLKKSLITKSSKPFIKNTNKSKKVKINQHNQLNKHINTKSISKKSKHFENNSLSNLGTSSLIKDNDTCNGDQDIIQNIQQPIGLQTTIPIFLKQFNKIPLKFQSIRLVASECQ